MKEAEKEIPSRARKDELVTKAIEAIKKYSAASDGLDEITPKDIKKILEQVAWGLKFDFFKQRLWPLTKTDVEYLSKVKMDVLFPKEEEKDPYVQEEKDPYVADANAEPEEIDAEELTAGL